MIYDNNQLKSKYGNKSFLLFKFERDYRLFSNMSLSIKTITITSIIIESDIDYELLLVYDIYTQIRVKCEKLKTAHSCCIKKRPLSTIIYA